MKDADIQTADRRKGQAAEEARALAQASREKAPAQSTTTTPDPLTRVNGESAMPAEETFSHRDTNGDNSSSGKGKKLKELFAESAANKAREAEDIARTPTSQIPTLSLENQLKQIPDTEPIKIDRI